MRENLAQSILSIVHKYREDDGISMSVDGVLTWADQFGDDSLFILSEVEHLIPKIYLSKAQAKIYTFQHLQWLARKYAYPNFETFLKETEFLRLQGAGKSQIAIVELVDEILREKYAVPLAQYATFPKRNFVYFDDVLATGSTLGRHLIEWCNTDDISEKIKRNHYRLSINLFCMHTWGEAFQKHRFNKEIGEATGKKILWKCNYLVENHAKFHNQKYNNAFPIKAPGNNFSNYLDKLSAEKYATYAYRLPQLPTTENFFSSKESRIRYENIILRKGLSIIDMINGEIKPNVRPLGLINPSYKTFGLGTHFVTWRNIPNNCPLVFWWKVPGHDWFPLFPRKTI